MKPETLVDRLLSIASTSAFAGADTEVCTLIKGIIKFVSC